MKNECPSCGNILEANQLFCPACGTKIMSQQAKTKKINEEMESMLLKADNYSEVCLSKNLGAGVSGSINYANLNKCEKAYLEIIEKFPLETKPYISYVDYMIKYILKIHSLKSVFASSQYFIGNLNLIIGRCRKYLVKAKENASEGELEKILQLDSLLTQKIEAINFDSSIKAKQEKNEKIAKWCYIGTGIFLGGIFLMWLIASILGI